MFRWPLLEEIAEAPSLVQFTQLHRPLAVIRKSHLMGGQMSTDITNMWPDEGGTASEEVVGSIREPRQ